MESSAPLDLVASRLRAALEELEIASTYMHTLESTKTPGGEAVDPEMYQLLCLVGGSTSNVKRTYRNVLWLKERRHGTTDDNTDDNIRDNA